MDAVPNFCAGRSKSQHFWTSTGVCNNSCSVRKPLSPNTKMTVVEYPGYSSAVIENPEIEPRGSLSASIRAMANSEVMDLMLKIGITASVLKTLGDIGNRWPPQT